MTSAVLDGAVGAGRKPRGWPSGGPRTRVVLGSWEVRPGTGSEISESGCGWVDTVSFKQDAVLEIARENKRVFLMRGAFLGA